MHRHVRMHVRAYFSVRQRALNLCLSGKCMHDCANLRVDVRTCTYARMHMPDFSSELDAILAEKLSRVYTCNQTGTCACHICAHM